MISKRTAVRRIPVAIVFTALVVRALQDVPESRLERCHATDDNRLPSLA